MILMLWLYACMFILMLGAEVNKMVFDKWNIGKRHKDYVRQKKFKKMELKEMKKVSSGRKRWIRGYNAKDFFVKKSSALPKNFKKG